MTRPRLRTILLIVNLAVLVLPLGSIFFFRIYENQLVHETETELISQAAFVAVMYKREIMEQMPDYQSFGRALSLPPKDPNRYYTPIDPDFIFVPSGDMGRR